MKERRIRAGVARWWLGLLLIGQTVLAQNATSPTSGTAFTYQGRLLDNGRSANGSYDLTFTLYDAPTGGKAVVPAVTASAVPVADGLFTVLLDFGSVFDGSGRWLEIAECVSGNGAFSTLAPRQALTPAPYAIYALHAGDVQSTHRTPSGSGISSGLPKTWTLQVRVDGVVTDPPAVLAAPYEEAFAVSQSDGKPLGSSPKLGGLVLRRQVTQDRTWFKYILNASRPNGDPHSVTISLLDGTGEKGNWDFQAKTATNHNYRLADDGLPVEEITFVLSTPVKRKHYLLPGSVPTGSGAQAGFTSGQTGSPRYALWIDGNDWSGSCVIGSDLSCFFPFGAKGSPSLTPVPFLLRQSVVSVNDLYGWYSWFQKTPRPSFRSAGIKLGSSVLQNCQGAWPCSYKLALGDDGLPYEEYSVSYQAVSVPGS